ncbi:MAG: hypothetical protein ACOVQN_03515, partial [Exiguobacterium sp.]
ALQTTDEIPLLWPALATLVFANAYQVLMLHRFQQTGQAVQVASPEVGKKKTKKQMSSKSS